MTIAEILANLRGYDEWDINSYPLEEVEAKTIIAALEELQRIEDDGK